MIKNICLTAGIFLTVFSCIFSEDISTDTDKLKNLYRQNQYQSAVKSGLEIIDSAYQKLAKGILNFIPTISNYMLMDTNINYFISDNNGIIDYYIQVEKSFSNKTAVLRISFDNSLNNVERYANLLKSFDFLLNKGGYQKLNLKVKDTNEICLVNSNNIYIVFMLEEKEDVILSGLFVQFTYEFLKNLDDKEKNNLMESDVRQFFDKVALKDITTYLK